MQSEDSELQLICEKLLANKYNKLAWVELAKYIMRGDHADSFTRKDLPIVIVQILNLPATYSSDIGDGNDDLNLAFVCYVNAVSDLENVPTSIWREIVELISEYSGSFCFEYSFREDFPIFHCEFYSFAIFCAAKAVAADQTDWKNWQSLYDALDFVASADKEIPLCKKIISNAIINWSLISDLTDLQDFISAMLLKLNVDRDPNIKYTIKKPSNLSLYSDQETLFHFPSEHRHDPAIINCKMLLEGLAAKPENQLPSWLKLIEYFLGTTPSFFLPTDIIPAVFRDLLGDTRSTQFQETCLQIISAEPRNRVALQGLERLAHENKDGFTTRITNHFQSQGLGDARNNILLYCLLARLDKLSSTGYRAFDWLSVIEFIWEHSAIFIPSEKMPGAYKIRTTDIPELQPFLHLSRAWLSSKNTEHRSTLLMWYVKFARRAMEKGIKDSVVINFILETPELQLYKKLWSKILTKYPECFQKNNSQPYELFTVFMALQALKLNEENAQAYNELIKAYQDNLNGFFAVAEYDDGDILVDLDPPDEWYPKSFPKKISGFSMRAKILYLYGKCQWESVDTDHLVETINALNKEEQSLVESYLRNIFENAYRCNKNEDQIVVENVLFDIESDNMQRVIIEAFYKKNRVDSAQYVLKLQRYQKVYWEYGLENIASAKVWCQTCDLRNWVFCYNQISRQYHIPLDVFSHIAKFITDGKLQQRELSHLISQFTLVCFGKNTMKARFFNNPTLVVSEMAPVNNQTVESADEYIMCEDEVFGENGVKETANQFVNKVTEKVNFSEINTCIEEEIAAVEKAKLDVEKGFVHRFFGGSVRFSVAEADKYETLLRTEKVRIMKFSNILERK